MEAEATASLSQGQGGPHSPSQQGIAVRLKGRALLSSRDQQLPACGSSPFGGVTISQGHTSASTTICNSSKITIKSSSEDNCVAGSPQCELRTAGEGRGCVTRVQACSGYKTEETLAVYCLTCLWGLFCFRFYFLHVLVFCLHVCPGTTCVPGACRGQKALDPEVRVVDCCKPLRGCWEQRATEFSALRHPCSLQFGS